MAGRLQKEAEESGKVKGGMPSAFATEWKNLFEDHEKKLKGVRKALEDMQKGAGPSFDDMEPQWNKKISEFKKDQKAFYVQKRHHESR